VTVPRFLGHVLELFIEESQALAVDADVKAIQQVNVHRHTCYMGETVGQDTSECTMQGPEKLSMILSRLSRDKGDHEDEDDQGEIPRRDLVANISQGRVTRHPVWIPDRGVLHNQGYPTETLVKGSRYTLKSVQTGPSSMAIY
jgi:hypothetical protein